MTADSSCALLTGSCGSGKTAAVYAVAEELGLQVLEVNASTCRTGKQVSFYTYTWSQEVNKDPKRQIKRQRSVIKYIIN